MNHGFVYTTNGGQLVSLVDAIEFESSKPFIPHYAVVEDITFDAVAAGCSAGMKCYNIHPPYAGIDSEYNTLLIPADQNVICHPEVFEVARFNYNIDQVKRSYPLLNGREDDEEGCSAYFGVGILKAGTNPQEVFGENTYRVTHADVCAVEQMPVEFQCMVLRAGEDRILRAKRDEMKNVTEIAGDIEHSYAGELDYSDFKLNTKLIVIIAKLILCQKSITRSNMLDPTDVLRLHVLDELFKEEFIRSEQSFIAGYTHILIGAAISLVCTGIITQ